MQQNRPQTGITLFTIGHSNHPAETFLDLLKRQRIGMVVDVRSSPYSGYASHFNKGVLDNYLQAEGIDYLYLGDTVGGRPEGGEFYDVEGYVLYDRVAGSSRFQHGVDRLLEGIKTLCATLLCGEEDPTNCHRRLLVGRVLQTRGVCLLHIRGDGRVQNEEELAKEEEFRKTKGQMALFDKEEPEEWKSTQSVLPRRAQPNSSGFSNGPESNG